jgi:NitT/TauT family transport system ATP-binding protein
MDITIENLSKSFGANVVLDRFSATIPEGKRTCIMGPSGCGKTTLLNIRMGLVPPDAGVVRGVPRLKSAVFQEDRLCEGFGAAANIRMVCGKTASRELIHSHLDSIDLSPADYLSKPVSEFSGGMKRRVAIVRAIMAESDIIFLDEPFKGLDEDTKHAVIEYVKKHTQGKTVILVTHDPEEVKAFGENLLTPWPALAR